MLINRGLFGFDESTDILTKDGWKNIKDINVDDYIVAINNQDNEFELCSSPKIFKEHYKGDIFRIKSQNISLKVLPDSNCFPEEYKINDNEHLKELIIKYQPIIFNFTYNYNRNPKDKFILPSMYQNEQQEIPMNDWLKFLGIYLVVGNTALDMVILSSKNKYTEDIIRKVLNLLHLSYKFDGNNFSIQNIQLVSYLKKLNDKNERFIPKEFLELSFDQLQILFSHMMIESKRFQKTFNSVSKTLSHNFIELAIKCGYTVKIYTKKKYNNKIYYIKSSIKNKKIKSKNIKKTSYDGYIYYLAIDKTIILLRHNKKVFSINNGPYNK